MIRGYESPKCTHLLCSSSLSNSQRDTQDGISTKLSLVGSVVKLFQERIDSGLVSNIEVLLNESRSNDVVDIGNSLSDT